MTQTYRILASCRTDKVGDAIAHALEPMAGVRVEIKNEPLSAFDALGAAARADMILIDVNLDDESEQEFLAEIIGKLPSTLPVIVSSTSGSMETIRLLMRIGIADFVPQPIVEADLQNSVAVARQSARAPVSSERHNGKVISVMRPAGGLGATTMAVHLAEALAADDGGQKVCLVDLDLQGGAVAEYLDVDNSAISVFDCLEEADKLDEQLIQSVATTHRGGFDVLPAPADVVPINEIRRDAIDILLTILCQRYDFVVIDTPPAWAPWVDHALQSSELLVVVTQLTVAALRKTRRHFRILVERGIVGMPELLVCNRHQKRLMGRSISLTEAEEALERQVDVCVPADFRLIVEGQNAGTTVREVRRGTNFEKSITELKDKCLEMIQSGAGTPDSILRAAD